MGEVGQVWQLDTFRVNLLLQSPIVAGGGRARDIVDGGLNRSPSKTCRLLGQLQCGDWREKRLTSVKGKSPIISGGGGISLSFFASSTFRSSSFSFSSPNSAFLLAKRSFSTDSIFFDSAAEGLPMMVREGDETKYLTVSLLVICMMHNSLVKEVEPVLCGVLFERRVVFQVRKRRRKLLAILVTVQEVWTISHAS